MKRYNYKVTFSLEVIAPDERDADGAIQELDYNFLETTGCASLQSFEMMDVELDKSTPLTKTETEKYFNE